MSGRRTFQKGAWARNKTRLLGKELLSVVNEGTASTIPGMGEAPSANSRWHLWAGLRQMSSPRAARPTEQRLPAGVPEE